MLRVLRLVTGVGPTTAVRGTWVAAAVAVHVEVRW